MRDIQKNWNVRKEKLLGKFQDNLKELAIDFQRKIRDTILNLDTITREKPIKDGCKFLIIYVDWFNNKTANHCYFLTTNLN